MSSVKVIGDVDSVENCEIYARNGGGLEKILYFCVIMSNVLGLRSKVKGQRQLQTLDVLGLRSKVKGQRQPQTLVLRPQTSIMEIKYEWNGGKEW